VNISVSTNNDNINHQNNLEIMTEKKSKIEYLRDYYYANQEALLKQKRDHHANLSEEEHKVLKERQLARYHNRDEDTKKREKARQAELDKARRAARTPEQIAAQKAYQRERYLASKAKKSQ
jgi:hypothetical protein